ncbi:FHA domain-containing protein, partial [Planctomycetota bacterium]
MHSEITFFLPDNSALGPFKLDRAIVVGRGTESTLVLLHTGISRRHCRITPMATGALVEDLGSTNGILYRDMTIREAEVRYGENFWLGQTRVHVGMGTPGAKPLPEAGVPVQQQPPPGMSPEAMAARRSDRTSAIEIPPELARRSPSPGPPGVPAAPAPPGAGAPYSPAPVRHDTGGWGPSP